MGWGFPLCITPKMEPPEDNIHCDRRGRSIGASKLGFRRYRCIVCGKTWTTDEPVREKTEVVGPVHEGCTARSRPHGSAADGRSRWRCPDCGKIWTEEPRTRGPVVNPDRPLTPAERYRRYAKKHPDRIRENQQRWRDRQKHQEPNE